jgi:4a-hydroxytetrahydrobiopterin dehydratase
MARLDTTALQTALSSLPGWQLAEGKLVHDSVFTDFKAAMLFVNQVADIADLAGHHPDIDIRYNKVRLGLVTHDAGGITEKDVQMAQRLSRDLKF